jgi:hypothetical protein
MHLPNGQPERQRYPTQLELVVYCVIVQITWHKCLAAKKN